MSSVFLAFRWYFCSCGTDRIEDTASFCCWSFDISYRYVKHPVSDVQFFLVWAFLVFQHYTLLLHWMPSDCGLSCVQPRQHLRIASSLSCSARLTWPGTDGRSWIEEPLVSGSGSALLIWLPSRGRGWSLAFAPGQSVHSHIPIKTRSIDKPFSRLNVVVKYSVLLLL